MPGLIGSGCGEIVLPVGASAVQDPVEVFD